jgi:hypothetical protein
VKEYGGAGEAKTYIIQRMRFACWITEATNTEYVVLIAFPWQQWLRERTSLSRYAYISCRVVGIAG